MESVTSARTPHALQAGLMTAIIWTLRVLTRMAVTAASFAGIYALAQLAGGNREALILLAVSLIVSIAAVIAGRLMGRTLRYSIPGAMRSYTHAELHLMPTMAPDLIASTLRSLLFIAGALWLVTNIDTRYGAWVTVAFLGAAIGYTVIDEARFLLANRTKSNVCTAIAEAIGWGGAAYALLSHYPESWYWLILGAGSCLMVTAFKVMTANQGSGPALTDAIGEFIVDVTHRNNPAASLADVEKARANGIQAFKIGSICLGALVALLIVINSL